jgi:hypothetical protein
MEHGDCFQQLPAVRNRRLVLLGDSKNWKAAEIGVPSIVHAELALAHGSEDSLGDGILIRAMGQGQCSAGGGIEVNGDGEVR